METGLESKNVEPLLLDPRGPQQDERIEITKPESSAITKKESSEITKIESSEISEINHVVKRRTEK